MVGANTTMEIDPDEIKTLINKYGKKLASEIDVEETAFHEDTIDYQEFKKENMPIHLGIYETLCNTCEKIVKIAPPKDKLAKIQESIDTCHFTITPSGVMSFAILVPLAYMILGSGLAYMIPILFGGEPSIFFISFCMISGIIAMIPLTMLPQLFANSWRMKASNQMVLCVFYIVTYMRHTSNIENALDFAAEHLAPPLSFDLKKILWDVETEKFDTVKESLDVYLEGWRNYNMEFIEAMHLIESSLFEGSETRRLQMLDKSLDVILQETYEKMLHYAHELKSPITILHMIGIILPILGLVILPLVVSFMDGVGWYHISILFNVIIPVTIFYFTLKILSQRPTGYGDSDISELNPELKKYKNVLLKFGKSELQVQPGFLAFFVFMIFLLIGMSPLIIHTLNPDFDQPLGKSFNFLEYRESVRRTETFMNETTGLSQERKMAVGPYGLGATFLSLFVVIGIGVSLGLYFKLRSQNVIKIRDETKKLEAEFASALFQLGNRMADGIPAELAFSKVADIMEGTNSAIFFKTVDSNIRRLGMSVEEAIFNKQNGAMMLYPSNIIESSMKVLIQSMKKGPMIAAQAISNVSRYIKEIHSVNERLQDLMADVLSSMKSQVSFLAPVISGIVIGITSMITTIIGSLVQSTKQIGSANNIQQANSLMDLFGDGLPTFYFQIVVGIYVIQVIYVLSLMINGVENGSDKLSERYILGKNLIFGTMLYVCISAAVILVFNLIAGTVLGRGIS